MFDNVMYFWERGIPWWNEYFKPLFHAFTKCVENIWASVPSAYGSLEWFACLLSLLFWMGTSDDIECNDWNAHWTSRSEVISHQWWAQIVSLISYYWPISRIPAWRVRLLFEPSPFFPQPFSKNANQPYHIFPLSPIQWEFPLESWKPQLSSKMRVPCEEEINSHTLLLLIFVGSINLKKRLGQYVNGVFYKPMINRSFSVKTLMSFPISSRLRKWLTRILTWEMPWSMYVFVNPKQRSDGGQKNQNTLFVLELKSILVRRVGR